MIKAPFLAMHNKENIRFAQKCGCYYCFEIFEPKNIKEWTDKTKKVPAGDTAICPYCGTDGVLADNCGMELTKENLESIHKAWVK